MMHVLIISPQTFPRDTVTAYHGVYISGVEVDFQKLSGSSIKHWPCGGQVVYLGSLIRPYPYRSR